MFYRPANNKPENRGAERVVHGWRVGETRNVAEARALLIDRLGIPPYDAAAADARLGELIGLGYLDRRIEGGKVVYVRTEPPVPVKPKERRPAAQFVSETGEVTAWPFAS